MATSKSKWLSDAIGTKRSYFRIGATRLKDVASVLQLRDATDSADADLKVRNLQITGGTPAAGEVLTSDASGNASWSTPQAAGTGLLPLGATLWHDETYWIVGTTFIAYTNLQAYGFYAYASDNGANFRRKVRLAAGTYALNMLYARGSTFGKLDIYFNGTLITNLDFYGAGLSYSQTQGITNVTVADGEHILQCITNGKNASSGGYLCPITKFWFKKSDDL